MSPDQQRKEDRKIFASVTFVAIIVALVLHSCGETEAAKRLLVTTFVIEGVLIALIEFSFSL